MTAVDGGAELYGTPVSDMQDDVDVSDGAISGTLFNMDGNHYMALSFSGIPSGETVEVGLEPPTETVVVEEQTVTTERGQQAEPGTVMYGAGTAQGDTRPDHLYTVVFDGETYELMADENGWLGAPLDWNTMTADFSEYPFGTAAYGHEWNECDLITETAGDYTLSIAEVPSIQMEKVVIPEQDVTITVESIPIGPGEYKEVCHATMEDVDFSDLAEGQGVDVYGELARIIDPTMIYEAEPTISMLVVEIDGEICLQYSGTSLYHYDYTVTIKGDGEVVFSDYFITPGGEPATGDARASIVVDVPLPNTRSVANGDSDVWAVYSNEQVLKVGDDEYSLEGLTLEKTVIIPSQEVTTELDSEIGFALGEVVLPETFSGFVVGETYIAIVNGESYETEAYDLNEMGAIGATIDISTMQADWSEYPFFLMGVTFATETAGTYTIEVTEA